MWQAAVVLLFLSTLQSSLVDGEPQVPCFFIFGDSLADSGNNNLLATKARANYPPYGSDFPYGPTGRFSNGKTAVDIIGELLGFEGYIPSYASSGSADILKGVNYASGSAGIRAETGQQLGAHVSMNGQLQNHLVIMSRLAARLGSREAAMSHLNQCLYYIGIGNNDYINNYYMPEYYCTSSLYTPEQYAEELIKQHSQQLKTLYSYGARKVVLTGVGLIGCTPNSMTKYGTNGSLCVDSMNLAAYAFNEKLKALVDELNGNFSNAKFVLINSFADTTSTGGFKVSNAGCCKVSDIGQCIPWQKPCENRDEYIFLDSFHPTEAANRLTANRAYKALEPSDVYPYDIYHLVTSGSAASM